MVIYDSLGPYQPISNTNPDGYNLCPYSYSEVIQDEYGQPKQHISNNEAEYESVIRGLKHIVEIEKQKRGREMQQLYVIVYSDSLLLVQHVNRQWKLNAHAAPHLLTLRTQVDKWMRQFGVVHVQYIPRKKNTEADALARKAIEQEKQRQRQLIEKQQQEQLALEWEWY